MDGPHTNGENRAPIRLFRIFFNNETRFKISKDIMPRRLLLHRPLEKRTASTS
jgi:hypothetical protein